jgi:hypothetical protein
MLGVGLDIGKYYTHLFGFLQRVGLLRQLPSSYEGANLVTC